MFIATNALEIPRSVRSEMHLVANQLIARTHIALRWSAG